MCLKFYLIFFKKARRELQYFLCELKHLKAFNMSADQTFMASLPATCACRCDLIILPAGNNQKKNDRFSMIDFLLTFQKPRGEIPGSLVNVDINYYTDLAADYYFLDWNIPPHGSKERC